MLTQLGLEDLQLTLRLVELELEPFQIRHRSVDLGGQFLLLLMCLLVGSELGERLTSLQETIDLEVEVLHVEQVGEARHLHGAGQGSCPVKLGSEAPFYAACLGPESAVGMGPTIGLGTAGGHRVTHRR